MVVAVGSLTGLWMKLPGDIRNKETLVARFEEFFGRRWSDVMIRAKGSYTHHQHWNAYLAVSDLELRSGFSLPALLADLRNKHSRIYQVLAG